jgi:hypothetical protein
MTQWFRWWHGAYSDPKLAAVAVRAKVSRPEVVAIWAGILEHASQEANRGDVGNPAEDIAIALALELEVVERVMVALRDKELIVAQRIAAWDVRQPQREDATATQRSQRFRARRNANATQTDGDATHKTPDETHQNRAEQNRAEDDRAKASKPKPAEPLPRADDPALEGEDFPLLWLGDETSADRQLGWLGVVVDELPERDRKPVTDFTRMAVAGKTLSEAQAGLLETLFQRHKAAIVAESNRRIGKRFPGLDAAAAHPVHGKAINRAMAARDDAEIDRLRKMVAEDLTPPDFLRRAPSDEAAAIAARYEELTRRTA